MVDLSSLYGGYQQASRYQRVPKSTLERALRPYSLTLASLKGKNDRDLRKMALNAVLDKYRKATGKTAPTPSIGLKGPSSVSRPKSPTPKPPSGGSGYKLF